MATYFDDKLIDPAAWVSQADAARLRGVSRQAIAKLVKKGRLRTVTFAGRTFVSREDIEHFQPDAAGRPKLEEKHDLR